MFRFVCVLGKYLLGCVCVLMRLDIITFKLVYIYDMRDQVALSMAIALA